NVYLCGLDLAALDYRDHAQGYAFWSLDQEKATRLGPTYSIAAGRVYEHYPQQDSPWRLSRAFNTYAHELSILFANEKRLVRVEPSALGLTGNTISADMLSLCARGIKPRFITQTIVSTKPHAEKLYHSVCKRACTALENAVARTVPVDAESSTELFALGGKALASAIALAARGELGHDVLTQAITALQSAAKPLDSGASV
ncbi:MAG TPA: hypothetical protein PLC54_08710, partial [Spirochaetales bacterium]|nr:hypothetical protein [Spirochaetales bacterium]